MKRKGCGAHRQTDRELARAALRFARVPMKRLTYILSGFLVVTAFGAQPPAIPKAFRNFRVAPSAPLRFLASEEGRTFLKATGHPLAGPAILAFGEPSRTTAVPPAWLANFAAAGSSSQPTAAPCSGSQGARFNLEPRAGAVPQNEASADFLLNRVGANEDLIVQAANDWRGNLTSDAQWDQSVSGYYVHRSAVSDCSVQFEGGLPAFTAQSNTEMGVGNPVVAADPYRDAFFMADQRFGSASVGGVGLFRVPASRLLNATACPAGTHTAAQASSCWMASPPVLLFSQPVFDSVNDIPRIAVDERPTSAGVGAGNVYVVIAEFNFNTQTTQIALTACSNALNCAAPVFVSGSNTAAEFPYVQVRSDGLITVSFGNANADGSENILFTTCTPAAAPSAPACGSPTNVALVQSPLAPSIDILTPMVNINLTAWTYAKHASREETLGNFLTFLTYETCKSPFSGGPCLDSEVVMTVSTDNGNAWTAPASVDTSSGHHFFPAISTDNSTGVVNLSYYSAAGDKYNHEVQVMRNQIARGGAKLGTAQPVTTILDPIDSDPQVLGSFLSDLYMGVKARGTGTAGQSHLYMSFDSTAVPGTYNGQPVNELNNHLAMVVY
jgi:hypothetical protein